MNSKLIVRHLGNQPYQSTWQQMQLFTDQRNATTPDELWLLEHPPVYTQGVAGKPEHVLNPGSIPIIQTDRGGQVTYHGPGQLMLYTLFDINRLKLGTRQLVTTLENVVIQFLANYQLEAQARRDAPGVYVNDAKICSIGLRIRKGCCYHGLALNVAMDLEPFSRINPCGYQGLQMAQLRDLIPAIDPVAITTKMIQYLAAGFGFAEYEEVPVTK